MQKLERLREKLNSLKREGDPNKLMQFFTELEGDVLPEAFMLDKARAIQVSDGNEYTLEDAERVLLDVIETAPDYPAAYLELGHFYDAAMQRSSEAVDVFQQGIEVLEAGLRDLYLGKAEALIYLDAREDALAIINRFRDSDQRFAQLAEELQ